MFVGVMIMENKKMREGINILKLNCTKQLVRDVNSIQNNFPKVAGIFTKSKLSLMKRNEEYMQELEEIIKKKGNWGVSNRNIVYLAKEASKFKVKDNEFYAKAFNETICDGDISEALKIKECAANVGMNIDITEDICRLAIETVPLDYNNSAKKLLDIVEFVAKSEMEDRNIYEMAFDKCLKLSVPSFRILEKISEYAASKGMTLTITEEMCRTALKELKNCSIPYSETFEVLESAAKAKMKDIKLWNIGLSIIIESSKWNIKNIKEGMQLSFNDEQIRRYKDMVTQTTKLSAQAGIIDSSFYKKAFDEYGDKEIIKNAITAGVVDSEFIINAMKNTGYLSEVTEIIQFAANAGINNLEIYKAASSICKKGNCRGNFYREGAFEVVKCAINIGIKDDEYLSGAVEDILQDGIRNISHIDTGGINTVIEFVDDGTSDILRELISLLADHASVKDTEVAKKD